MRFKKKTAPNKTGSAGYPWESPWHPMPVLGEYPERPATPSVEHRLSEAIAILKGRHDPAFYLMGNRHGETLPEPLVRGLVQELLSMKTRTRFPLLPQVEHLVELIREKVPRGKFNPDDPAYIKEATALWGAAGGMYCPPSEQAARARNALREGLSELEALVEFRKHYAEGKKIIKARSKPRGIRRDPLLLKFIVEYIDQSPTPTPEDALEDFAHYDKEDPYLGKGVGELFYDDEERRIIRVRYVRNAKGGLRHVEAPPLTHRAFEENYKFVRDNLQKVREHLKSKFSTKEKTGKTDTR